MFKIGDSVRTNNIWNEKYGNEPISGTITNIRKYLPKKIRWETDYRTVNSVPQIVFGEYDPEITLLTIDGNKEHEMNETLFEYND